ncbi:hypothetical protein EXIGLDRAFT_200956 [Exidia glandulosa HHB12029]|uniref:Myosin motor domain-containing protein n=1 Tax=Exidia glandulosa HHB12029 TaxID=1314781 RepID=A0A166A0Z3_EXIGL|nr:hypothetical protein EXIGLDRAFT_200956 [Exidia glandulosa HHB12029]
MNPYKQLPHMYSDKTIAQYRGRRRTENQPHIYAIAEQAWVNMGEERENQSILITSVYSSLQLHTAHYSSQRRVGRGQDGKHEEGNPVPRRHRNRLDSSRLPLARRIHHRRRPLSRSPAQLLVPQSISGRNDSDDRKEQARPARAADIAGQPHPRSIWQRPDTAQQQLLAFRQVHPHHICW